MTQGLGEAPPTDGRSLKHTIGQDWNCQGWRSRATWATARQGDI